MEEQVRMQDEAAQALKAVRLEQGALVLQSTEARPVFEGGKPVDLAPREPSRSKELIEILMVAANDATARSLKEAARHSTEEENDASKVERHLRKSAAALLLSTRVGDRFDGVVTGSSEKGTWVRSSRPRSRAGSSGVRPVSTSETRWRSPSCRPASRPGSSTSSARR